MAKDAEEPLDCIRPAVAIALLWANLAWAQAEQQPVQPIEDIRLDITDSPSTYATSVSVQDLDQEPADDAVGHRDLDDVAPFQLRPDRGHGLSRVRHPGWTDFTQMVLSVADNPLKSQPGRGSRKRAGAPWASQTHRRGFELRPSLIHNTHMR